MAKKKGRNILEAIFVKAINWEIMDS